MGEIYWPPGMSHVIFMEELNNLRSMNSRENRNSYVMGDLKFDLLKYPQATQVSDFAYLIASFSYVPLVSRPTRVECNHVSLLDNEGNEELMSRVLQTIISHASP